MPIETETRKFERDLLGRNFHLNYYITISGIGVDGADVSFSNGNIDQALPLVQSVSKVKESIDYFESKFKISNMTVTMVNTPAPFKNGKRFSELYGGKVFNKNVSVKLLSQSSGIDEAMTIYGGVIRDVVESEKSVTLTIENVTERELHRDLPLEEHWTGSGDNVPEKNKNKPMPMVYGYVDKSPIFIYERNVVNEILDGEIKVIADGRVATHDTNIVGYQNPDTNFLFIENGDKYATILKNTAYNLDGYTIDEQYEERENHIVFTPKLIGEDDSNPLTDDNIQVLFFRGSNSTTLKKDGDVEALLARDITFRENGIANEVDLIHLGIGSLNTEGYGINFIFESPEDISGDIKVIANFSGNMHAESIDDYSPNFEVAFSLPGYFPIEQISGFNFDEEVDFDHSMMLAPDNIDYNNLYFLLYLSGNIYDTFSARCSLRLDSTTLSSVYNMTNFTNKRLFAAVFGRRMANGLFSNFVEDVMEDIISVELGFDHFAPSFDFIPSPSYNVNFTSFKEINSKKLLEGIASNTNVFPFMNQDGQFDISRIKDTYSNDDVTTTIKSKEIISMTAKRSDIAKLYTKVAVRYNMDYLNDNYKDITSYGLVDGYDYDLLGLNEDDSKTTLVFEADYLRDNENALMLRNFRLGFHCNLHSIFTVKLPPSYMGIKTGDIIKFDSLYKGITFNSEDYTVENIRNGQTIYPYFIVEETQKNDKGVDVKLLQLHDLNIGITDEEVPEDDIQSGSFGVGSITYGGGRILFSNIGSDESVTMTYTGRIKVLSEVSYTTKGNEITFTNVKNGQVIEYSGYFKVSRSLNKNKERVSTSLGFTDFVNKMESDVDLLDVPVEQLNRGYKV
jgi:hypothetical protein